MQSRIYQKEEIKMTSKLYVIGNGFDLAHKIPSTFNPDFKNIALKYESGYQCFWDLYQTENENIWSDFENLLSRPDFNVLEDIFEGYAPDYSSDRESDRDDIINQVSINGNLKEAVSEFASKADTYLENVNRMESFEKLLDASGYYISFNYTHTLENVYNIQKKQVLHIHGEVGKNNLELGFPEGNFKPEKYKYDVRQKGKGPYAKYDIDDYVNQIEDYYIATAYRELINKCKSFSKPINVDLLIDFLDKNHVEVETIIVYGHSCAIDFDYFIFLNKKYPNANWNFYVRGEKQERDVQKLVDKERIMNSYIYPVETMK